jgi:hypothetical protein
MDTGDWLDCSATASLMTSTGCVIMWQASLGQRFETETWADYKLPDNLCIDAAYMTDRHPVVLEQDGATWTIDFNTMNKTANCNVGIASLANQIQANVYPNPTSDVLQIELDETLNNAVATLQDVQGKVVYSQSIEGKQTSMSVGHLVKGMYMLHISAKGKELNKKIIIE